MDNNKEDDIFVLELPLSVEKWQSDLLDRRYEYLRQIYNYAQRKLIRQYIYLVQTEEYKKCKTKKDKSSFFAKHEFWFDGIKCPITFSEFGIKKYVTKLCKLKVSSGMTYKDFGLNSSHLEVLGANMWAAWDKKIYGKGERINIKRHGCLNTFSVRRKSGYFGGLKVILDGNEIYLFLDMNGKKGEKDKKEIKLTVKIGKMTEYEMQALKNGIENIRMVTIARKLIRGKYKYYVQFAIKDEKPKKGRKLGKGSVGIDVGPSTVAVSSLHGVEINMLAEKCDDIHRKVRLIQRKMDRSSRASNPQNYNEDGTIKKVRGQKLKWARSKNYMRLRNEKRELMRKQAAIRKLSHNIDTNKLLELGDTFVVEDNPISSWTKRASGIRKGKNGKNLSNKRYGKSVANHAPAAYVEILKNKVESLGGKFIKVDTKNGASGYDFTTGEYTKHGVEKRKVTLSNGNVHQRDMLAAFNLQHLNYEDGELKSYNVEEMEKDYPTFCRLEKEEIKRYTSGQKTSHKSTVGY